MPLQKTKMAKRVFIYHLLLTTALLFLTGHTAAQTSRSDSIVMQGCTIERGASIQYTILDKNVTVRSGTRLLGSPEHPLIIRKGVTV